MTKIDIISGFLGAGKTTFIKKMLEEAFVGEQIVLIENEFGEVGIDGGFLKDAGIEITEMNSGCICCSLVGDFATNLNEVIEKYHPDRILIEPSGVGKLSDVMKSVIDIEETQDVKLNALVTVVNAIKAKKQMKAFGEFFNNQIEHATTIVLSRSQNANAEQLEECVKMMQELNHDAAIITTAWDAIDGKQILNVMEGQDNLEMKVLAEHHAHHHHHDHDEECCCGHHHEEHHHHDHDEECCCGHHHEEHHHHDHDEECCCGHHHDEEHECHHEHHHHDHDEECCCGHHHEEHHHHDHDEECCCGHHHHDHDEECCCGHHHHHDHDEECGCGHHHHDHHHDADDVFASWGTETAQKFGKEKIENILKIFAEGTEYGMVLRAKGIVEGTDGEWIHFDYVPGEPDVRTGSAEVMGRICVIGSGIDKEKIEKLFME